MNKLGWFWLIYLLGWIALISWTIYKIFILKG